MNIYEANIGIVIPRLFRYRYDGKSREANSTEPFTGTQFFYTDDFITVAERSYKNGKLHGVTRYFSGEELKHKYFWEGREISDEIGCLMLEKGFLPECF